MGINLETDANLDEMQVPHKIALIDADTLVYAVAIKSEYPDELLPREMYSDKEWQDILDNPNYDEKNDCIWDIDIDTAYNYVVGKIQAIVNATFTTHPELYFTSGKNFRYTVDPMYKANRVSTRYPVGIRELRAKVLADYEGEVCTSVEADDVVCYLKRNYPDKYVLCAVDKDVYKSVPGEHFNYYESLKYNIKPKFVTTSLDAAEAFPYIQTLMGDATDNIAGCPGIGPKKAEKALSHCKDNLSRWNAVCKTYKSKRLTVKDAIRTMRLVNMNQTVYDNNSWVWNPWRQPMEGNDGI